MKDLWMMSYDRQEKASNVGIVPEKGVMLCLCQDTYLMVMTTWVSGT